MTANDDDLGKRFAQLCSMTNDRLEQMLPMERDRMLQDNLAAASRLKTNPRATRLIFEYGLDFVRQAGDSWSLASNDDCMISPYRVQRETGFRPIIAWVSDGNSKARSYVLPLDYDLKEIDTAPRCITQVFGDDGPPLFPAYRFRYHISAIAYRLLSLSTHYAWRSRTLHTDHNDLAILTGTKEIAFEVEACITTTVRLIEVLREVYGDRFGVPANWDYRKEGWNKLLQKSTVKPNQLVDALRKAWCDSEVGIEALNEFRNIIEHRHLFSVQHVLPEKLPLPGIGTGFSFYMPDDPFKKHHKEFTFSQRKDALTYCWKSAVAAIEVAKEILKAAGEYHSPYPYPDEGD